MARRAGGSVRRPSPPAGVRHGRRAGAAAGGPRLAAWLPALALAAATGAAYHPAWRGQPLWDDAAHMTRAELRPLAGLARIWLEPGATQQYYPLTHTAFWLQSRLWDADPLGHHLVGIALHLTVALLLWRLLLALAVPGALLAAAVFALHPVHVESVAWISELKNTLSAVLFLAAAGAYLRFDATRRRLPYALALAAFTLALLAKSVTAALPAVLLVLLWWQRGRLAWRRDLAPLLPFLALGAGAGAATAWVERHHVIGALTLHFDLGPVERVLLAGRALAFYLGKLLWPAELVFFYPRWEISRSTWWQYLFPLAALVLTAALWALRRRWRGPLAAWLLFAVALAPALGFVDVYPFRYAYVADHFQYLASLGPIALLCALAAVWLAAQRSWRRTAGRAAVVLVLVALATLTWRQCRTYADAETLYRRTLERNPGCWLALNNLGVIALGRGDAAEAERLFAESLRRNPRYEAALNNLGLVLARRGLAAAATDHYRRALAIWPDYPDANVNLGNALFAAGDVAAAVPHYERALRLRPDLLEARNNLAFALVALERPLAAIPHFEAALALARRAGRTDLAAELEARLARCRSQVPTREASAPRP